MLVLLTLSAGDTSQGVPRSTRPRWTASTSYPPIEEVSSRRGAVHQERGCPPREAAMWRFLHLMHCSDLVYVDYFIRAASTRYVIIVHCTNGSIDLTLVDKNICLSNYG